MTIENNANFSGAKYLTASQIVKSGKYPWLTEGALRHLIFQSKSALRADGQRTSGNGLARAIVRVGRKVLIDINEFDDWIQSGRQETSASSEGV